MFHDKKSFKIATFTNKFTATIIHLTEKEERPLAMSSKLFYLFLVQLTNPNYYIYVLTGPREELLKVVGLSHDEPIPSSNELFRTKVSWQKPIFNHTGVSHYSYEITNGTEEIIRNLKRRTIDLNTVFTTVSETICVTLRLFQPLCQQGNYSR